MRASPSTPRRHLQAIAIQVAARDYLLHPAWLRKQAQELCDEIDEVLHELEPTARLVLA
jgi:hypothetical protein